MLKQWITDTFTDSAKSEYMMYDEVYEGYGQELDAFGVVHKQLICYSREVKSNNFYSVYEFTKGGEIVLVKFQGFYEPYYGVDFHSWSFVTPKKVERVEYV